MPLSPNILDVFFRDRLIQFKKLPVQDGKKMPTSKVKEVYMSVVMKNIFGAPPKFHSDSVVSLEMASPFS